MATLKLTGFEALKRELERKGEDIENATEAALNAGADVMLDHMQQFADEAFESRTGDLRKAIKKKVTPQSAEVGVWSDDVFYAYFVEYGHAPPGQSKRPRDWKTGRAATKAQREKRQAMRREKAKPTPPHPFIAPAYYSARDEAVILMGETLKEEAGL